MAGVLWQDAIVLFVPEDIETGAPAHVVTEPLSNRTIWSRRETVQASWFAADSASLEAPLWDNACDRWGWNTEMKSYVEAQIGWTLLEQGPADHGIIKLVGSGGSGKSTLLRIVAGVVGAGKETALINLGTRFGSQICEDARMLIIPEADKINWRDNGTRHGLATLKAISGGDKIPIEPKGRKQYSTAPLCAVWIASNHPQGWASGANDLAAWQRRDRMIEMKSLTGQLAPIPKLAEAIILMERNPLAVRSVHSYVAWLRSGKPVPACVQEFTENQLFAAMSAQERFIATCLTADPRGVLSETELERAALRNGIDDADVSKVKTSVSKLVYTIRRKRGYGWAGVRLVDGVLDDATSSEPSTGGMSAEDVDAQLAEHKDELW